MSTGTDAVETLVGRLLLDAGLTLAVAESCTGGLVAERVTSVGGSSRYFLGGVVAYANETKTRLLGVAPDLLAREGAVSEAVARAMAVGARERLAADVALSVTGIAGPGGGTPAKPVGLVYVGYADALGSRIRCLRLQGSRGDIRESGGRAALELLSEQLRNLQERSAPDGEETA